MQNQICKTRSEGSKEEWIRHQNKKKEQPPYPALHSQINNNRKKNNSHHKLPHAKEKGSKDLRRMGEVMGRSV